MLNFLVPYLIANFCFFGMYFTDILHIFKNSPVFFFFITFQVLITLSFCSIYVYNFLAFTDGTNLTLKTTNKSLVFQGCPPTVGINIFFQFMQFCLENILHPSATSNPWFNPLKMDTFDSICTGKFQIKHFLEHTNDFLGYI